MFTYPSGAINDKKKRWSGKIFVIIATAGIQLMSERKISFGVTLLNCKPSTKAKIGLKERNDETRTYLK